MKTKGEVFHIKSYFAFSSFAGMYPLRHSVLKGPWQFPCPILAGLKVPVYKVKFVIRKFLPGGNYHQVAVIISSDHTMPHYRWWIYLISLHFNFRGQDKIFLINSITLLLKLAGPPEACRETTVTPSLLLSPFSSSTPKRETSGHEPCCASRDRFPQVFFSFVMVVSPSFRWFWGPPTENHRVPCYRCWLVACPAATDSPVLLNFSLSSSCFSIRLMESCCWRVVRHELHIAAEKNAIWHMMCIYIYMYIILWYIYIYISLHIHNHMI